MTNAFYTFVEILWHKKNLNAVNCYGLLTEESSATSGLSFDCFIDEDTCMMGSCTDDATVDKGKWMSSAASDRCLIFSSDFFEFFVYFGSHITYF